MDGDEIHSGQECVVGFTKEVRLVLVSGQHPTGVKLNCRPLTPTKLVTEEQGLVIPNGHQFALVRKDSVDAGDLTKRVIDRDDECRIVNIEDGGESI